MAEHNTDNPITRRLDIMREQWKAFEEKPDAKIARWFVDDYEEEMLWGLLAVEGTEAAKIPSLFLTYQTKFANKESYTESLIKDFWDLLQTKEAQEDFDKHQTDISKIVLPKRKDTTSWLNLLASFADLLPNEGAKVIAFLHPQENDMQDEWLEWLESLLTIDFPDKVRVMLMDLMRDNLYEDIQQDYPLYVHTIKPDLDMSKAMEEALEEDTKDRADEPIVIYKKKALAMSNLVGKQKMKEAEALGEEALAIAAKLNWKHHESYVLLVLGNGYLGVKDLERGLKNLNLSRKKAQEAAAYDLKIGRHMEVQAIISIAGAYIMDNDFEKAGNVYLEGTSVAAEISSDMMELECYRMAAYCDEQIKDYKRAWQNYHQALEVGKKMAHKERISSTLPYVGDGLIRVAPKVKGKNHIKFIEEDMAKLLNEDWRASIINPK